MKRFGYIILFALGAMSCSLSEMEMEQVVREDMIQVVTRVVPFGDCIVESKASKIIEEVNIECIAFLIFDNAGECIDLKYYPKGDPTYMINRSALSVRTSNGLTAAKVYAFANMPVFGTFHGVDPDPDADLGSSDSWEWYGKTLEYFEALDCPVSDAGIPTITVAGQEKRGLPMMGTTIDEDTINLTPDAELDKTMFEVRLFTNYAKILVTLKLEPEQDDPDALESFQFQRYEIHNIPTSVDFIADEETYQNPVTVNSTVHSSNTYTGENPVVEGASRPLTFWFYVPERLLQPRTSADDYQYPFGSGTGIRDEDKILRQRFKPSLVDEEQNATFVKIFGVYTNHQGHNVYVEYDVYLGSDSYGNFEVRRNMQYNNTITIRGATKHNAAGEETIQFDNRVTIDDSGFRVSMERETLLDAHFEVRPIRLDVIDGGSVKVEIKDAASVPWIRLESPASLPGADSDSNPYILSGNSRGKRKYFTTTLLNEIASGTEYTFTGNGDYCVWVYVDENTTVAKDDIREAVISITHYDSNGNIVGNPLDYTFAQTSLYPVETTRKEDGSSYPYYIESYEEYLYNYDSTDSYGQTEWDGMEWGLDGIQLSHIYDAAHVVVPSVGFVETILSIFGWNKQQLVDDALNKMSDKPLYDYYLDRDEIEGVTNRNFMGHEFNKEIAAYLLMNYGDNPDAKLNGIKTNETVRSAIAYCYNKNRRNNEGNIIYEDPNGGFSDGSRTWNVANLHWYLPSIDEIEDIAENAYAAFDGVFQGNYYWSCQSAYRKHDISWDMIKESVITGTENQGTITGNYYTDDPNRVRATRALWANGAFAGVPDSGADTYGTQEGTITVNMGFIGIGSTAETEMGAYVKRPEFDETFKNHPANLPRSGTKARVRCVYKP